MSIIRNKAIKESEKGLGPGELRGELEGLAATLSGRDFCAFLSPILADELQLLS